MVDGRLLLSLTELYHTLLTILAQFDTDKERAIIAYRGYIAKWNSVHSIKLVNRDSRREMNDQEASEEGRELSYYGTLIATVMAMLH